MNYIKQLQLKVEAKEKEIRQFEAMLLDFRSYLSSPKFRKFQDSSPNELNDYINVSDALRRTDMYMYKALIK